MHDDQASTETILFTLDTGSDQPRTTGLSKLEIERTRVFFSAAVGSNQYGTIANASWTIKYRNDGSGTVQMSFSESIQMRLISGKTTVSLNDIAGTALATWDVSFWRQCGSRTISFEQPISDAVGELTTGISFFVDGTLTRC